MLSKLNAWEVLGRGQCSAPLFNWAWRRWIQHIKKTPGATPGVSVQIEFMQRTIRAEQSNPDSRFCQIRAV